MPSRARWLLPFLLLLSGALAGAYAVYTSSSGSRSIAVGLSSTLVTAGLVDLFGLLERRRQALPIERVAAMRVGEVFQTVLQIVATTFPGLSENPGTSYRAKLLAYPNVVVSQTEILPNLHPPQTRAQHIHNLHRRLEPRIDDLLTLLTVGALDGDIAALEEKLRNAWVLKIAMLELPPPIAPAYSTNDVLRSEAADLVDQLRPHFDRARRAIGDGWPFGDGSP